ncbi:MAG: cytochrome D1 domain-containing protein [Pseudomonadales bacterium]
MARRVSLLALLLCSALVVADERRLDDALPGQARYLETCARCHQPDGGGVAGVYPPLHNAPRLWSDRSEPIRAVLGGRSSQLDDSDRRFDHAMPNHGYLGNEVIAETLTFIQAAWGPGGAPFTAAEVAAVRLALLSRAEESSANAHGAPEDFATLPSPLAQLEATRRVTSEGPPLTTDEFARAQALYYGLCTGCHGVMREGTAGNPLTPDAMQARGTDYLRERIGFGVSTGMPAWGTDARLEGDEIDLLARFLQHPVSEPPDMDLEQIRDSWRLRVSTRDRATTRPSDNYLRNLIVVTLHDVGQLAFIDSRSRRLIGTVDVCQSPHEVTVSASGRYLYAICRDGTLSQIDLWASPPARVASVRVGYEARAVAASAVPVLSDGAVLAGAYWPPQLVMLDGTTLEPLKLLSTRNTATPGHPYHPEPRVSDIVAMRDSRSFIASIRETGELAFVDYSRGPDTRVERVNTLRDLRAGHWAEDNRYLLIPADSQGIAVIDSETRAVVAEIPAPVLGASSGTRYVHETLGPVWVTANMRGNELIVIGTDPQGHPLNAWKIAAQVPTVAAGSLFLSTHPAQPDLWLDAPLAHDPAVSGSLTVFSKHALEDGYDTLPVARWSGLETGPRRALQPTFAAEGKEVWTLVWNPQNEPSAIVIIDAITRAPRATLTDPRLITPTRIYRVGDLIDTTRGTETGSRGAQLFAELCANCHGPYGAGDGPLASSQSVVLKDLRDLTSRAKGAFPRDFVTEIIDGRAFRAEHGPEGMPLWGAELLREAPLDPRAESEVAAMIEALTDHLEEMQR